MTQRLSTPQLLHVGSAVAILILLVGAGAIITASITTNVVAKIQTLSAHRERVTNLEARLEEQYARTRERLALLGVNAGDFETMSDASLIRATLESACTSLEAQSDRKSCEVEEQRLTHSLSAYEAQATFEGPVSALTTALKTSVQPPVRVHELGLSANEHGEPAIRIKLAAFGRATTTDEPTEVLQ